MSAALWIVAYFAMATASSFMRGYAAPRQSLAAGALKDWANFLLWPLAFPSVVAGFAAVIRMGERP